MKPNGVRKKLIYSFTRQELIEFIKGKDATYYLASFAWHKDEQLRELAISVNKKIKAEEQKSKKIR